MRTRFLLVSGILFIIAVTGAASGSVLFVDDDAPSGGDGSGWPTAYRFLQDALEAARQPGSDVTEIRVGQGVYVPTFSDASPFGSDDVTQTFSLVDGVALVGGFAGLGAVDPDVFDPELYESVLESELGPVGNCCEEHPTPGCNQADCRMTICAIRPLCCTSEWDETCVMFAEFLCHFDCNVLDWRVDQTVQVMEHAYPVVLIGFTITPGNSHLGKLGGGVIVIDSEVDIRHCKFVSNVGIWRDAINLESGSINIQNTSFDSCFRIMRANNAAIALNNVTSSNCSFGIQCVNSTVTAIDSTFDTRLPAIDSEETDVTIDGCTFTRPDDGFTNFWGNGLSCEGGSITVRDSLFLGLGAERGGAVNLQFCLDARFEGCRFEGNRAMSHAGAIRCWYTPLELQQCDFIRNRATGEYKQGLAGAILAVSSTYAIINNCTFIENYSETVVGAITVQVDDLILSNCTFRGNATNPLQGGWVGAALLSSYADVINCVFENNSSFRAGAVLASGGTFVNCSFIDNRAMGGPGGAVLVGSYGKPSFTNCLFNGNSAQLFGGFGPFAYGGAVAIDRTADPTLTNCTFTNNESEFGGGALAAYSINSGTIGNSGFELHNCILWNNTAGTGGGEDAQIFIEAEQADDVLIANSNIEGWTGALGGFGNINIDPLFIDIDGPDDIPGNADDDLHLAMNSPCIDAGNNNALLIDIFDVDQDGIVDELYPFDLDGNPRVADDPDIDDLGCGVPAVVDMGAYERIGVPAMDILFGDLDGDGVFTGDDIVQLLNDWASVCDEQCCPADLTADGVVDVFDLLLFLKLWR